MKKKNLKKMIAPLASVIALGAGFFVGMEQVAQIETVLIAMGAGVLTLLGIFGVIENNDEE